MILFEGFDNFKKMFRRENYFSSRGRVSRREFWTTYLVAFLIELLVSIVVDKSLYALVLVVNLAIDIPMAFLRVRRVHDSGHSGKIVLAEYCLLGLAFLLTFIAMGLMPISVLEGVLPASGEITAASVLLLTALFVLVADLVISVIVLVFLLQSSVAEAEPPVLALESKPVEDGKLPAQNDEAKADGFSETGGAGKDD